MNRYVLELLKTQTGKPCVGAAPTQIARAADRIGTKFPPPFVAWLTVCNGSRGGAGGILGVDQEEFTDLDVCFSLYPHWKERQWTPVAGDGCGNHYVLVYDSNVPGNYPVCFIDSARDERVLDYAVASCLERFLKFLIEREMGLDEGWPFEREWFLQNDPEIEKVTVARLPWNVD